MIRHRTKVISVANVKIGGGNPIVVQSMTKTATFDVRETVAQIRRLEKLGCEIIRVGIPDQQSVRCLGQIKKNIKIPLVADIHFQWQFALEAIEQGVDKIRINPGTMAKDKLTLILDKAKEKKIPIRIGVNSGSLKSIAGKKHSDKARLMVQLLLEYVRFFERACFFDIVLSLKAADVPTTVRAYKLAHEKLRYPLHVGITEAGLGESGLIKSSVGIGVLLAQNIGDTIRVSLTDEPEKEVKAAYAILQSLNLRQSYPEIISCPTCARTQIDIIGLARKVALEIQNTSSEDWRLPLKIAIMGCVVNGPGEAKEADFGLAGGKGSGIFFRQGKAERKIPEKDFMAVLRSALKEYRR